MLKGSGVEFHREPRLDIAMCKELNMSLIFLPASDIPKVCGNKLVPLRLHLLHHAFDVPC
jgi:ATP phosphoribosyltransferase